MRIDMRAAGYAADGRLVLEERPVPVPEEGEVLVAIGYCGICGTDIHEYLHGPIVIPTTPHSLTGAKAPLVLGHEGAGVVVAAGAGAGIDPGTRVGLDLFGARKLVNEDPMKEFLRLYPKYKLIPFNARQPLAVGDAMRLLAMVAQAADMPHAQAMAWPASAGLAADDILTRGAMCSLLRTVWSEASEGFARK